MRRGLVVGLLLLVAGSAFAGSYTVTTSNREDTLIQREVDARNQRRGSNLTAQDWVQDQVNESLRPLKQQDRATEAAQACAAFAALSGAAQDAITAQLGGRSPCP